MIPDYLENFFGVPALSIRQPWASLIVAGYKEIENRSRRTKYRGPVLIHVSLRCDPSDAVKATTIATGCGVPLTSVLQMLDKANRGGIIGVVDIVDCVDSFDSPYFFGPYGYVLENPRELPFTPCKGALGFFKWEKRMDCVDCPEESGSH